MIQFLSNHPQLDPRRINEVVEYLHAAKFADQAALIGEDVEIKLDPPHPELSIQGWTVASLLRRVDEWTARRPNAVQRTLLRWDRSVIKQFVACDPAGRTWTIRELLDSDALATEGQAMDRCVAT